MDSRNNQQPVAPPKSEGFESAEHESLNVPLPDLDSPYQNLPLQNGAELPFGTIIALAGDYYAVPKRPISTVLDTEEQIKRFMDAYNKLAYSSRWELNKIMGIINKQERLIKQAMREGKPEYIAVENFAWEENIKAALYTKFRFVDVSAMNIDHFGTNAKIAHHAGHIAAKRAAARAHYIADPVQKKQMLAYAYSLEAFACHFLTDHFAAGHMRTPRLALYLEYGADVGAILSLFMHGEDNYAGLNVTNNNGDAWKTYGDAHLFESYDARTREIMLKALKIVVDEVHQAYSTGDPAVNVYSKAYKYLPTPTAKNNTSPMFINDAANSRILYRTDLDNIYSTDYATLTPARVPCVLGHFLALYIKDSIVARASALAKKIASVKESVEAQLSSAGNKFKQTSHSFFSCCKDENQQSGNAALDSGKKAFKI